MKILSHLFRYDAVLGMRCGNIYKKRSTEMYVYSASKSEELNRIVCLYSDFTDNNAEIKFSFINRSIVGS